jgi:hypothetical protein
MGFSYFQHDNGKTPPIEYNPGKAGETFVVGEALVLTADALTKCGPTTTPTHICVGPRMADNTVPATRVTRNTMYSAPLSADGAALKLGDKVTLGADGMTLTATTASGVAEIARITGTAVGDELGVRFS